MTEIEKTQYCPYCEYEVEDHRSEWEEGEHKVDCDKCGEEYLVNTVYDFKGWECQKLCKGCNEAEEDCYCDLED